ncbi:DUF3108 domain-containing protein [bacterium]|nr:MAG: DUF3108 domain-containing protein [bacterium]
MNRIIVVIIIFLAALNITFASDSLKVKEYRKINQTAFGLGEKINYEIKYGFVTAGTAALVTGSNYIMVNGRNCYDINLLVNSSSSFEWVYKFDERYSCVIDAEGIFPWKYSQRIREGRDYKRDFEAIFDQDSMKVRTYTGEFEPKKFEGEYKIPQFTQDALCAFYWARTTDFSNLNIGDMLTVQSFYNEVVYNLRIKYLGTENIEVQAGEFRCRMFQPMVKEGVLNSKADDIIVWITDDERRLPVRIQISVIIGSVKVDLVSYSGLAGTVNAKLK